MENDVEINASKKVLDRIAEVLDAEFQDIPVEEVAVSLYLMAINIGNMIGLDCRAVEIEVEEDGQP